MRWRARSSTQARKRAQNAKAIRESDSLVVTIKRGVTSEAVVDALTQADRDKRAAEEELRNIHALPVVILHPTVAVDYRAKVAELEHAVKQDDASRLEAIPILRALIERIVFTPADAGRRGWT